MIITRNLQKNNKYYNTYHRRVINIIGVYRGHSCNTPCCLWSLIIFLIQRSCLFQPCLYPMKTLHPISKYTLPRGGVQRGGTPSARSEGPIPPVGGFRGKRAPGEGRSPQRKNCLVKVYCNFIVNLDRSL
jgi:hypothetical protein